MKDIGKVQVFSARPSFEQLALLDTGPIRNHVNFANNGNGKFAYTTIGGTDQVKVYQRGPSPTLVATIPVGDLPYVALGNGNHAVFIERVLVKVEEDTIPCGHRMELSGRRRKLSFIFEIPVREIIGNFQDKSRWRRNRPRSTDRDWRAIKIAASVRLANWLNVALHRQRSLSTSTTGTQVSPIPSSDCFDSTLLS